MPAKRKTSAGRNTRRGKNAKPGKRIAKSPPNTKSKKQKLCAEQALLTTNTETESNVTKLGG